MTPNLKHSASRAYFLSLVLAGGCVGKGADTADTADSTAETGGAAPTVLSTSPANGQTDVPLNGSVSALFSEEMDPATLTVASFTLTSGDLAEPATGTVIYADSSVSF